MLTQEQVTEKYMRFRELTKDTGLFTPPEAMQLLEEIGAVDENMLAVASDTYMKAIGREGKLDWGLLGVTGF